MGARTVLRYTISVDGAPKRVLSVGEGPKGDLYLALNGSAYAFDAKPDRFIQPEPTDPEKHQIDDYHCSIHPSLAAGQDINTIKMSRRLGSGQIQTAAFYTNAIKTKSGFVPVVARRCGNFMTSKHDLPTRKPNINFDLGNLEENFTLTFLVCVAAPDLNFTWPDRPRDFQIVEHRFKLFKIVLLYSFLNLSSNPDSVTSATQSIENTAPLPGINEFDCGMVFWVHRVHFKKQMIHWYDQMFAGDPERKEALQLMRYAEYFEIADTASAAYQQWQERLRSPSGVFVSAYPV